MEGFRSRLETPLTVVVVVAQGKAKLFWLDIHGLVLAKPYQFAITMQGATIPRQTDAAIRFLAQPHFA